MPFSIAQPTLIEEQEYTWRAYEREDISELHALLETASDMDDDDFSDTPDDMQREYEDPWSDPRRDAQIIRNALGKIVAFARVFVNPQPTDHGLAFLWRQIATDARDTTLEQDLLEWMERRACERLEETAGDRPRIIRAGFPDHMVERRELYEAHGYQAVRYFYRMQRDLAEPIPDVPLPDGLTLRTYGKDIDRQLMEADDEAFRDHWGYEPMMQEDWDVFVIGKSEFRPQLTFVVMDGDEVAGFSINRVREQENKRLGINEGWIGSLGVRRPWRKRGIASFLLCESLRAFRAQGFDTAGLGVDAENLTGALQLYERLGFRAIKTRIIMEKRVV